MSVAETTTAPERSSAASRKRLVSTRLLRSEVRLIGGRRRNQMGLLVLAASIPAMMLFMSNVFGRALVDVNGLLMAP